MTWASDTWHVCQSCLLLVVLYSWNLYFYQISHQCRLSERHVTHSSRRTPIFTFHMLAAQNSTLIKNNLSALFALTSDKGKNQTLQTNQSHTLRSHGSMHNFAMFQCKNCFAVECSVLLNAYVYILYNHIKIYTGMHTHTRTHTNCVWPEVCSPVVPSTVTFT